jgi:hypothetical protein
MAASKETTDKPTTKTPKAAAAEVAKVQAGTTDKGQEPPATDPADPDGLIYSQADLDQAVADAKAAILPDQANLDELVNAERQQILRALKGDGALPPDVREALDKELAGARKEGFDAGKEEALEELAEKDAGSAEPGPDDADYDDFQSIVGRGIILGIILKMPESYRVAGEKPKLDEIDEFLQSIEAGADRVVAVEIIKSLAENRPTDLASPNYQAIVKRGLKIVRGEAPDNDPHADDANSPTAAFERMQRASAEGGSDNYVPPQAMPAQAPEGLEGEELEAYNRMQRAIAG